jgi:hypothetical protein
LTQRCKVGTLRQLSEQPVSEGHRKTMMKFVAVLIVVVVVAAVMVVRAGGGSGGGRSGGGGGGGSSSGGGGGGPAAGGPRFPGSARSSGATSEACATIPDLIDQAARGGCPELGPK